MYLNKKTRNFLESVLKSHFLTNPGLSKYKKILTYPHAFRLPAFGMAEIQSENQIST